MYVVKPLVRKSIEFVYENTALLIIKFLSTDVSISRLSTDSLSSATCAKQRVRLSNPKNRGKRCKERPYVICVHSN